MGKVQYWSCLGNVRGRTVVPYCSGMYLRTIRESNVMNTDVHIYSHVKAV